MVMRKSAERRRGLLLASSFVPLHGSSVHVYSLAAELARRGFPVTAITSGSTDDQASDFPLKLFRWFRWPPGRPVSLRAFLVVVRAIAVTRPRLAMATFGAVNLTLLAAAALRVPHRLAWYQTLLAQNLLDRHARACQRWQLRRKRLVYKMATHVLAISQAAAIDLEHWYGLPLEKIEVFRLGLKDRWAKTFDTVSASRQQPSSPRILCVCRMHPSKGPQVLLEAATFLKAKGMDFNLRFGGVGPLRSQLERDAASAGLQHNCAFLGFLRGGQLETELAQADLIVVPSLEEAFGLMILEGLAAGLPVVAFRTGAVPELFANETHGLLVEERTSTALAGALERLLCSSETRTRMGRAGRQHFLAHFELGVLVREQADRLSRLMDAIP